MAAQMVQVVHSTTRRAGIIEPKPVTLTFHQTGIEQTSLWQEALCCSQLLGILCFKHTTLTDVASTIVTKCVSRGNVQESIIGSFMLQSYKDEPMLRHVCLSVRIQPQDR
jgi:hypothetical protein